VTHAGSEPATRARVCECGTAYVGKSEHCADCRKRLANERIATARKSGTCQVCGKPITAGATHCVRHRAARPRLPKHRHIIGEIVDRYQSGESGKALAEAFGVANRTVYLWLREQQVEVRPRFGQKKCVGPLDSALSSV